MEQYTKTLGDLVEWGEDKLELEFLSIYDIDKCIFNFPYLKTQKGINYLTPIKVDIFGMRISDKTMEYYQGFQLLVRTGIKRFYSHPPGTNPWEVIEGKHRLNVYQIYYFDDNYNFKRCNYHGYVNLIDEKDFPYETYDVLYETYSMSPEDTPRIILTRESSGNLTKGCR